MKKSPDWSFLVFPLCFGLLFTNKDKDKEKEKTQEKGKNKILIETKRKARQGKTQDKTRQDKTQDTVDTSSSVS